MKNFGKLVLTAVLAVALGGVCMACYSGKELKEDRRQVTQNRTVGYFSKVESRGSADIRFVQGKGSSVRIVGPKSAVDNIVVENRGDALTITHKSGNRLFNTDNGDVTIYITSPDLTDVSLIGSGSFKAEGNIDTDNLRVLVKGSGDVDFHNVVCDGATFETRGSGDIEVSAIDARSAKVSCIGSGDVEIKSLKADNADFLVRGSGDINTVLKNVATISMSTYGSGDIDARMIGCGSATAATYGSGDITLIGSLGSLSQTAKGSGEVHTGKLVLRK